MRATPIASLVALISVTRGQKPPDVGQRPPPWIKYDIPNDFAAPGGLARPTFRYWVPDADVDDLVLRQDLEQIKASGWGGAEIICLENYGIEDAVVDPALYGYGGSKWYNRFHTMLQAADSLKLIVDFALGPTQGASIPILDPDSPGMNTELAYGHVNLTSGQYLNESLPAPEKTDAGYANRPDFYPPFVNYTNQFVAAVVARKSNKTSNDPRTVQLDYPSVVDVTPLVNKRHLEYKAPDDGAQYVLISFWQRRTGYIAAQGAFNNSTSPDNPASWFAYVVDHFSQEGTDLWTRFTEKYVMQGTNGDLLRKLGVFAWEDSAEFRATLFWTDQFIDAFNKSRNYSPIKALPSYFGTTGVPPSTLNNGYYYFGFNDANGTDISVKLRNDYRQALQELYEKYHLDGLSQWSASWGLQGSVQPYATAPNLAPPWDMNSAAAHIDAPETESNYFDGVIDAFRAMGGGAMLGRKQIFSSELGAHRYESYAITWPVILNDCKINYAGGVNRIVTHGYPYSGLRPDAEWPGLTTFEWLYSEMWGPRQPSWKYVKDFSDWIARSQLVLQTGVPRVDLAIYRHKYISVDIKHYGMGENIFGDPSLADAGYSYVSISPSLLKLENAVVSNGVLAFDGPAFSAFIVDNSTNITAEAVTRFLEYAEEGFPIIFVGHLPQKTPYYCESCDEYVKSGVQKLLKYPSVKYLDHESEVSGTLQKLNVLPAAQNLLPTPILYVHRWDESTKVDYFWAYNSDIYKDHETEASIKAAGIPYELDAWTGTITPVLNYTAEGDRYRVWINLKSNQTTILAFAPNDFFSSVAVPRVHIVATAVQHLSYSTQRNSLFARDTRDIDNPIRLSDGRLVFLNATGTLLHPTVLGPWNLTVQDWQPGPHPQQNYTSVYTYHHFTLEELIPWPNITGLANTSGIGTYTTRFDWNPPRGTAGSYLDLGDIFMTARVWINNQWIGPLDVEDPVADISPYLVKGSNAVKIEVSTTLRNRLLVVNVTQSWEQSQYSTMYGTQPYGLTEPVTLIPFIEAEIPL